MIEDSAAEKAAWAAMRVGRALSLDLFYELVNTLETRAREYEDDVIGKADLAATRCFLKDAIKYALDSAARREAALRELCNERKWSVMVDNDGRMEDALLAVDVLRVLESQRGENE